MLSTMRRMILAFLVLGGLLLGTLLTSCEFSRYYGRKTVLKMAKKWEEEQWRKAGWERGETKRNRDRPPPLHFELLKSQNFGERMTCGNYGEGCVGAEKAKVRLVTFVMVEYEKEEQAREMALKLDQYYKYNWLFDEVTNEPVIESFVKSVFGARRAHGQGLQGAKRSLFQRFLSIL